MRKNREEIIKDIEKETKTNYTLLKDGTTIFRNYDGQTFIFIDVKYKILSVYESHTRCPDLSYKTLKLIIELMEY